MHVHIRCRRVGDALVPADMGSAFLLKAWKSDVMNVELQDDRRAHSRQQEKFWHGVICPVVAELWRQDKEWSFAPSKGLVHGAFMAAVFGLVKTPVGEARRSSTTLTLEEYSQLIDAAREHALEKYGQTLPEPGEGE